MHAVFTGREAEAWNMVQYLPERVPLLVLQLTGRVVSFETGGGSSRVTAQRRHAQARFQMPSVPIQDSHATAAGAR